MKNGHHDQAARDSFAGLPPSEYHQWRLESELYQQVEKPVMLPLLRAIPFHRALDIGCGTGIWTCELRQSQPEAKVLGIDLSHEMLAFASEQCEADFSICNALSFRHSEPFDLIVSGLSADYIGFSGFAATVQANLAGSGEAYAWFIDPKRYPCCGSYRVKTWQVRDRTVQVQIPDYDVNKAIEACTAAGLSCTEMRVSFELSDGIERTLVCLRSTAL